MDDTLQQEADEVASNLDADIIYLEGTLSKGVAFDLLSQCIQRTRRPNVLLILITPGGDPNAAYRIARCLQRKYKRLALYAPYHCKSSGTLIATGAHELIMSDLAELGPLDIQMSKKDELWEQQSGLTVADTLISLQEKALILFEHFFLSIQAKSDGAISLRTAADIATRMATGLFEPLYRQVDPIHVGEAGRAMRIAGDYGERLLGVGGNITKETLESLMIGYPSHDFVIDRWEADDKFHRVREPSQQELDLAKKLYIPPTALFTAEGGVSYVSSEPSSGGGSAHEEDGNE